MEHKEAVRLQAAEKYLMGELSNAQRDEYEEHYFDCPSCAEELKATVAFMESAKQVAHHENLQPVRPAPERAAQTERPGFFAWLRPAFAIPVFAALLFFIGYQNAITIPRLKQSEAHAVTASTYKPFSLPALGTRAEGTPFRVSVRANEAFTLDVDMPGNSSDGYLCQVRDQSGRVYLSQPISSEAAKDSVHLLFPGGSMSAGSYTLLVFKGQDSAADASTAVARQSLVVEFIP
jgi:hypothetical protein